MSILIQLVIIILGLLIFILPMKHKLALLVFSFICLDAVQISFGKFKSPENLFCLFFFLSEIPRMIGDIKKLRGTIIFKLMVMMLIASFVLLLFSPHYHKVTGPVWIFLKEMVFKYFALAYGYVSIHRSNDFKPVMKTVFVGMLLLTFIGMINWMTKSSPWLSFVQPEGLGGGDYREFSLADRFRVQSMFLNPFCYGYVCLVCFLVYLYSYKKRMVSKMYFAIVALCSIFGIFSCGCRTLWLLFVMVLLLYYSILLKKKQFFKTGLLSIAVMISIWMFLPEQVKIEFMDKMSQAFTTDTNVVASGGSSVGMRLVQFAAVLNHVQGHYLFGLGKDYFLIDMGWGEGGLDTVVDEDLWGLEGIYMGLLLERGIVGLMFWVVFCFLILFFFYKIKIEYKDEASLGISLIMAYMLFSCMTGELNSAFPTFLLLGVIMRISILNQQFMLTNNQRSIKYEI